MSPPRTDGPPLGPRTSLVRAIATVGGLTALSRVLGFARDVLTAALLGAGPVADAFFVAFRLPNLFRRLFAEGAFNAAFVPLTARRIEEQGLSGAVAGAGDALAVLLATLLVLTVAAEAAMPALVTVLAPGFADEPQQFALAVEFSRIMFPYLLFMSLTALLGGLLNVTLRFAAAAAAPILLNLGIIAGLLYAGAFGSVGHGASWGVVVSGVAQFLLLAIACRRAGILPRLPRPALTPYVRRLLRLMGPGTLGAGVLQVNIVVGTMIASLLPQGAIAWLYYADRLYQLPLGIVGIAIGTAILPQVSRQLRAADPAGAQATMNRALEYGLLLTLPATVALLVIPETIVRVLFARGAFGPEDARMTATALAAYAAGLPAFVLVKALAPGFYAREDTRTPVIMAAWSAATNIVLSLVLMYPLGHVGIAAATTLAAWLNVAQLGRGLMRRGYLVLDAQLRRRAPRMLAAALAMGTGVLASAWAARPWLDGSIYVAAPVLVLLCGLGAAAFFAIAELLGACRVAELRQRIRR